MPQEPPQQNTSPEILAQAEARKPSRNSVVSLKLQLERLQPACGFERVRQSHVVAHEVESRLSCGKLGLLIFEPGLIRSKVGAQSREAEIGGEQSFR